MNGKNGDCEIFESSVALFSKRLCTRIINWFYSCDSCVELKNSNLTSIAGVTILWRHCATSWTMGKGKIYPLAYTFRRRGLLTCVPFQYISIRFRISPSFPADMGCRSSTLYFCYSWKKELKPECMLVLA